MNRIVYSTDPGSFCPQCGQPLTQCLCQQPNPTRGDGVVRISRETKGRKGKGVTVIRGIPLTEPELQALAKKLKQQCASGGRCENGVIEIQGDHRELAIKLLSTFGWTIKRAGG